MNGLIGAVIWTAAIAFLLAIAVVAGCNRYEDCRQLGHSELRCAYAWGG